VLESFGFRRCIPDDEVAWYARDNHRTPVPCGRALDGAELAAILRKACITPFAFVARLELLAREA
jgi:hypothetical protein